MSHSVCDFVWYKHLNAIIYYFKMLRENKEFIVQTNHPDNIFYFFKNYIMV
jgi:hypothetical protein